MRIFSITGVSGMAAKMLSRREVADADASDCGMPRLGNTGVYGFGRMYLQSRPPPTRKALTGLPAKAVSLRRQAERQAVGRIRACAAPSSAAGADGCEAP